ncbi:serine/threonine-protein kinase pakA [Senna tora]|uniref:Serine/threonine-protein kinase pakA n=1 Tax=Senna tora TaxID=362788 RepID=A0A834X929_9FABA|nr:serine/threonine-protein kinase pakA [Senna tora]
MEGVGARLGRSSTRYGPATVFNGPVRKWKKKWVHVSPSSASASSNANNNNGTSNGNNGSHLVLYKWTPITQSQNGNTNNNNVENSAGKEDTAVGAAPEEPPRRKFKYVPVALLEEQKNEAAENEGAEKVEDEAKPIDIDPSATESTRKGEILDDKPDINDIPVEESQSQEKNQVVRQDLNESLDLSLGLTSHDDERDSGAKPNHMRDGQ